MSNRDGLIGGFLFGAIVGSIAGAATGFLLSRSSRSENGVEKDRESGDRRPIPNAKAESLEVVRESLEDKILQLNHARTASPRSRRPSARGCGTPFAR